MLLLMAVANLHRYNYTISMSRSDGCLVCESDSGSRGGNGEGWYRSRTFSVCGDSRKSRCRVRGRNYAKSMYGTCSFSSRWSV